MRDRLLCLALLCVIGCGSDSKPAPHEVGCVSVALNKRIGDQYMQCPDAAAAIGNAPIDAGHDAAGHDAGGTDASPNDRDASQADSGHAVCTPGQDQTCNDRPEMSALAGVCHADGTCTCMPPFAINPQTGRCRPP